MNYRLTIITIARELSFVNNFMKKIFHCRSNGEYGGKKIAKYNIMMYNTQKNVENHNLL